MPGLWKLAKIWAVVSEFDSTAKIHVVDHPFQLDHEVYLVHLSAGCPALFILRRHQMHGQTSNFAVLMDMQRRHDRRVSFNLNLNQVRIIERRQDRHEMWRLPAIPEGPYDGDRSNTETLS